MIHKTIVGTNVTNGITVQNIAAHFSDDYLDYNSRYNRLLYALQSINHWYNVQESHL